MNKILQFLFAFFFCLCITVMFFIGWSIIDEWIVFYSYGWIWNEYTATPIILSDIFFDNILAILVITTCITSIGFFLYHYYYHYREKKIKSEL